MKKNEIHYQIFLPPLRTCFRRTFIFREFEKSEYALVSYCELEMRHKCVNCKQMYEKCDRLHEKIKILFKSNSLKLCKECFRIQKVLNPSEEDIQKKIKMELKKKKLLIEKNKIKNNIKSFNENTLFLKELKEHRKEMSRKWHHRGSLIRASRNKSIIELTDSEKKQIRNFYYGCPPGYHVDHIIPISKGGKHCLINLQYLPALENIKKHNKIIPEILEKFSENGVISRSFLQYKFKLSYDAAEKIMEELGLTAQKT